MVEHPSDYSGLIFSHQEHLSMSGGVARMAAGLRMAGGGLACANCHKPTKDGQGFEPVEMTRDCGSCHSLAFAAGPAGAPRLLPHGHVDKVIATLEGFNGSGSAAGFDPSRRPPGLLDRLGMIFTGHGVPGVSGAAAGKIRALFAPRGLCAECHAVVPPAMAGSVDYKIVPINQSSHYLPWGGFNHAVPAHRRDDQGNPTCASCHSAETSANPNELLMPRIAQCATCHGKTKDKIDQAASADCSECHSYHAPGTPTRKDEHKESGPGIAAGVAPHGGRKLAQSEAGPHDF